jgi:SAM-dependent methyltransferase
MSRSPSWSLTPDEANAYDRWYESYRGRRWLRVEGEMLRSLLAELPDVRTVLEVGCGTGRFCTWLKAQGYDPLGLDRSSSMLFEASMKGLKGCLIRGEAHRLPFAEGAVDVVVFITTLEFLEDPEKALREAARVARRGLILLVLNRWSLMALWDWSRVLVRKPRRASARRLSVRQIEALVRRALPDRTAHLTWTSSSPPWMSLRPLGSVLGWVVALEEELKEAA